MTSVLNECLDVRVGYQEAAREDLIKFLKANRLKLGPMTAERGMWGGVKILRIRTADADALHIFIVHEYLLGDDCEFEIYFTEIDARRSMTYLPDYDSEHGYETFDL